MISKEGRYKNKCFFVHVPSLDTKCS